MSTSRSYFVTLRAYLGNFYRKTGLSEEHCIFKKTSGSEMWQKQLHYTDFGHPGARRVCLSKCL